MFVALQFSRHYQLPGPVGDLPAPHSGDFRVQLIDHQLSPQCSPAFPNAGMLVPSFFSFARFSDDEPFVYQVAKDVSQHAAQQTGPLSD